MQWHLRSWKNATQYQQPDYPDPAHLEKVARRLAELPPLVTPEEIDSLKQRIAEAASGDRFILQTGDCAESFDECSARIINKKHNIFQQMSLVLMHKTSIPVTVIGRIAGQYAKPRTHPEETIGQETLPSYRGDLINGSEFSAASRIPDPERLLHGYGFASTTLNYIRSLKASSLTKLKAQETWQEPLLQNHPDIQEQLYSVAQSINLMNNLQPASLSTEMFTSHEALHLHYEQAMTRFHNQKWYNLSTHFPWVGMRTAKTNSSHVEYLRGITNPLAIKVSPSMKITELLNLIDTLNPKKEKGKITLITRLGANQVSQNLPGLIQAVNQSGQPILWSCDPMHGNTRVTTEGLKTRDIETICRELALTFQIHLQNSSHLGSVHLEVSGDNSTECSGGICQLTDNMLSSNYTSLLDPRLSRPQAFEIALFVSDEILRPAHSSIYLTDSGT